MRSERILFVFEGEKTEHLIAYSMLKEFFDNGVKEVVRVSYGNNIYHLYSELVDDDGLDFFLLLQEKSVDLKKFSKDDFSQIFLFFDYDKHDSSSCDSKLLDMIQYFSEETGQGMIFISYPMVECIQSFSALHEWVVARNDVFWYKN